MAANLYRFRVELDGWQGAPGLNTYYIRFVDTPSTADLEGIAGLLRTAYDGLKLYLINGLTIKVNPGVDVIRDTDGVLQSAQAITPPATVTATSSATQVSRATMALARLNTDAVVDGRRLRGRIFLGPVSASAISADGSLAPAMVTAIAGMYSGLLDVVSGRIVVWHRPSSRGATDGDSGFVQSVSAKPVPAVLRSRRD
jgi:hypothetical protein